MQSIKGRTQPRKQYKPRAEAEAERAVTPKGTMLAIREGETDIAHSKRILAAAAPAAAQNIVDIANGAAEDKDRFAASKDILDRNAVGKQLEGAAGATIPVAFLTAALAGIALLAGRDMAAFGDMTTLQEDLENIKQAEAVVPEPTVENVIVPKRTKK